MNLTIRSAHPDDHPQTVALTLAAYATAYVCADCGITEEILRDHVYDPVVERPSFGARIAQYHKRWLETNARFRVACIDGTVVGFATTLGRGGDPFLDGLYVHPDAQGKGIGSRLLADAEQFAGGGMSLWAIEHSRSLGFYRSRNYQLVPGRHIKLPLIGGPYLKLVYLTKT